MAPHDDQEVTAPSAATNPRAMPHALSMVYGGGAFGIVYGLGVAPGLTDAGIAVASAPALGCTSTAGCGQPRRSTPPPRPTT